jgi:hypothetical protein
MINNRMSNTQTPDAVLGCIKDNHPTPAGW